MDWLLPYNWAAALSTSGMPMTSWGSPGPRRENRPPATSALNFAILTSSSSGSSTRYSCNGPTARYATRRSIWRSTSDSPGILDRRPDCRGHALSRIETAPPHRQMVERDGELRFGQLKVRDRTPEHS
jgi:hypothetical protein